MATRPVVLQGSEQMPPNGGLAVGEGVWFDGISGVWRERQGGLAVRSVDAPGTKATATREGTDQSEVSSALSTQITKTREGADQADCTSPA
jgi:hypothetical protein